MEGITMWRKIFGGGTKAPSVAAETLPSDLAVGRERMPRHIAIIMDGARTLKRIVRAASDLGIEVLTVYAFSTENWKRPKLEVDFLLKLFDSFLEKELAEMHAEQVRLHFIGRRDRFSERFQQRMADAETLMAQNTGIHFNLAANYGSQDEILRAVRSIAERAAAGEVAPEEIDEEFFSNALDTAGISSSARAATCA